MPMKRLVLLTLIALWLPLPAMAQSKTHEEPGAHAPPVPPDMEWRLTREKLTQEFTAIEAAIRILDNTAVSLRGAQSNLSDVVVSHLLADKEWATKNEEGWRSRLNDVMEYGRKCGDKPGCWAPVEAVKK